MRLFKHLGLTALPLLALLWDATPALATPSASLTPIIQRAARQHGLDPRLIEAVIQAESNFENRVVSNKGAMGLMQLMPETAKDLGVKNPYDPEQNIQGGARYLRDLLERFSSLKLALAAYNAGPTTVDQYGGIPPYRETQDYVKKIMANYTGTTPLVGGKAMLAKTKGAGPGGGAPIYRYRDANGTLVLTDVPPAKGKGRNTTPASLATPRSGSITIRKVERGVTQVTAVSNIPNLPVAVIAPPPVRVAGGISPVISQVRMVADATPRRDDNPAVSIRIAGARY